MSKSRVLTYHNGYMTDGAASQVGLGSISVIIVHSNAVPLVQASPADVASVFVVPCKFNNIH